LNNAAMNQATGYLATDLASQQITVNTVVPGLVGTEGREVWAENMAKQQNVTKEEFVTSFCKRMGILAGRWATMEEVADTGGVHRVRSGALLQRREDHSGRGFERERTTCVIAAGGRSADPRILYNANVPVSRRPDRAASRRPPSS
jgi:NAD(P)-dependent dehydrogenase (short-subunit alcohol dehydrogenase family)